MKYISLSSGSCGNSHYIEGKDTKLIVDAGISGRKIVEHLAVHNRDLCGLDAILVTHEHFDHIQAVGILSRKFDAPIYATEKTWEQMKKYLGKIADKNIVIFEKGETLEIGSMEVDTFAISHDAADPVGYAFRQNNKKLAIVTDLGIITDEVFQKIKGADIAVVESNYDDEMLSFCSYSYQLKQRIRSEVGHLSNSEAGYLGTALVKSGTKKLLLAHLSKESNLPQLAFQTVGTILTAQGLGPKDVGLDVMLRGKVSRMYSIE
ncbi:MAG: MBL fold metallo-hydrolase [Peptostreptococcaceae bacterium]|nr:MBL fold metallo-hydrolase [Peptostreptococcaceae bacterium]